MMSWGGEDTGDRLDLSGNSPPEAICPVLRFILCHPNLEQ